MYCAGGCFAFGASGGNCKGLNFALGGMLPWRCGCGGICNGGGEPVEKKPEEMSGLDCDCQRLIGGRCNGICNGGPTGAPPTGPGGGNWFAMLSERTSW